VVGSPNPANYGNGLNAVAAVSANDVWAVGDYSNGTIDQTLLEHWDGSTWSVAPSPNVGTHNNDLYGIAAAPASSGAWWAVGAYIDDAGTHQTLILGPGGVMPSPNVGTHDNGLNGVAAVSANDVWVVGGYSNGTTNQTLVERYNPCPPTPSPTSSSTPTSTATSCPIQFSDVPDGSTFYPYVHCLACLGIVNGYPDHTFRPNNQVTRGQLSKIVSNSAGFHDAQPHQMFEDVPVSSTFQVYVGRLASRGYINGYPCGGAGGPCVPPHNLPYFRPNSNATRGQISKIDANAAEFNDPPSGQQFEDVPVGSTYYTYTYRLASRSVMSGYPCGGASEPCVPPGNLPYFRPNNNATRGQSAKIVSKTFFPDCNVSDRVNR
jgi:hypothetical protein